MCIVIQSEKRIFNECFYVFFCLEIVIALAVANPQRSPFLPSLNLNKFQPQQQEGMFGPQPQQFNENFLPAFQGQRPTNNNQFGFDWNFNPNGPNGGDFNGFPQQQQPNLNQQQVNQQSTNQQISSQQPWNQQSNQQPWSQQRPNQQQPNQQQTNQFQMLLDLLQPNQLLPNQLQPNQQQFNLQQSNQQLSQQSSQQPNQRPIQQPNQSNINQNFGPNPSQNQNQIPSSNSNQNSTSIQDLPIDIAPVFPFAFPAFPPEFLKCMRQDCLATSEYNPVCGSDRTIYTNDRKLGCANYCGRRLYSTQWTGKS